MKDIKWASQMPKCDFCHLDGGPETDGPIDAPTRRHSPGRGQWANMCARHFEAYGIDTSITTRKVPQ